MTTTIAQLREAGLTLAIPLRELTEPLDAPTILNPNLDRFPIEVYNLTQDSRLFRFLNALAGDSGAGFLKKQMLMTKLQSMLDSTHFQDIDLLYGSPLGLSRNSLENYDFDPQQDVLTHAEWTEARAKDASYRTRCLCWMRAVVQGPTVQGMALAAQAALGVECDVVERHLHLDNIRSDEPVNLYWTSSFDTGGFYDTNNPTLYLWSYALAGGAVAPTISSDLLYGIAAAGSNYLTATSAAGGTDSVILTTNEYLRVTALATYTFTAFWRRATGTGDPKGFMRVACFNEAGGSTGTVYPTTVVSGITHTPAANGLVNPNAGVAALTWQRWGGSLIPPVGTVKVKLQIAPYGTSSAAGITQMDSIQFEAGDQATVFGFRVPGETKSPNETVIIPHAPNLSDEERRSVNRLIDRLRPIDSFTTIESGDRIRSEKPPIALDASSSHFHVQRFVTGRADVAWPTPDRSTGFWIEAGVEKEAPTQAFQSGQETATVLAVQSVVASSESVGNFNLQQQTLFPQLAAGDAFDVHAASRAYSRAFSQLKFTGSWINRDTGQ